MIRVPKAFQARYIPLLIPGTSMVITHATAFEEGVSVEMCVLTSDPQHLERQTGPSDQESM